jgi:hypothetical protein
MFVIDYRFALYTALVLGCLGTLVLSKDKIRNGYLFFILTLGLGWRTFHVTKALRIHPAEVVIWTLFVCCLAQSHARHGKKSVGSLPLWLWVFIPFWILGWIPAPENAYSWDVRFSEFRNFLLLVPLLIVTRVVLAKRENWRFVALTMYCVSFWIAVMGLTEYVFQGLAEILPGFVSDTSAMVAADGFLRARFSFYGSPDAVCVCALALPMGIILWHSWPTPGPRSVVLGGAVLQIAAIYISGNRAIWFLLSVLFVLFALLSKRYMFGAAVLLFAWIGYQALPATTQSRVLSLSMILEGRPIDSSGVKRWERAMTALNDAWEWPLGRGWAAAGWVHSDFIQIAANLGVIAGLIFIGAYASTLWRLWLRRRSPRSLDEDIAILNHVLLLSFFAAGWLLTCECLVVLPQTLLPIWLIWALAETWLRQTWLQPKETATGTRRVWNTFRYRGCPPRRVEISPSTVMLYPTR